jgi:phage shock protein A
MNPNDETDLSGLDLDQAKEYIFAYALDAKRLEKEIAELEAEQEKWKARVSLAEGKLAGGDQSMAALAQAASAKVAELALVIEARKAERAELRAKVEVMRKQLPLIRASERSIDPDRLLAELQLMTGELLGPEGAETGRSAAATEADFAKLEADAKAQAELDALKKRANGA